MAEQRAEPTEADSPPGQEVAWFVAQPVDQALEFLANGTGIGGDEAVLGSVQRTRAVFGDAMGRHVPLEALLIDPQERPDRFGLTENVRRLLTTAGQFTEIQAQEGRHVVDSAALLRALLSGNVAWEAYSSRRTKAAQSQAAAPSPNAATMFLDALSRQIGTVGVGPMAEPRAPEGLAVAPGLVAVLADAAFIADVVSAPRFNRRRIELRHLLAALLRAPSARTALASLTPSGLPDGAFAGIGTALLEHVVGQLYQEEAAPWADVMAGRDGWTAPPPPGPPVILLADYIADDPHALPTVTSDPLDVIGEAQALAELACLEEAPPPLAIGLFGAWGSGKTTFMGLIEKGIKETTARAAALRAQGSASPFVENVVHIRFNAWTYSDTGDLWASLATELFRQLAAGGHQARKQQIADKYLAKVQDTMAAKRGEVATREQKAAALERARDAIVSDIALAEQEIRRLHEQRARAATATAARAAIDLALADPRTRDGLRELGVAEPSVERLEAEAGKLRGLAGEIAALCGAMVAGPHRGRHRLHVALAIVVAGLAVGGGAFAQANLGGGFAALGNFVATLTLLGGAVWKYARFAHDAIRPVLDAKARIDAAVARAQRDVAEAIAAAEKHQADLEVARAAKEGEIARVRAEAEALRGDLAKFDPSLLPFFLRERGGADEWRAHLGIVALVREALEELSTLLAQDLARFRAGTLPTRPIERIVLYIDDLDRCQHQQVAQVLQAVHLLLAFPIFVVVVGVDARWLAHSLGKVYADQLRLGGTTGTDTVERATVSDYLEKIFQIPYWLRPITDEGGRAYQRLVNQLTGRPLGEVNIRGQLEPVAQDDGGAAQRDDGDDDDPRLSTIELTVPEPQETAAETWQRMTLTDGEIGLMRDLGFLVGQSPRAVKRFVNLYRLIRAGRHGPELQQFLHDTRPDWPIAMLALAMEVGLSATELADIYDRVLMAHLEAPLEQIFSARSPDAPAHETMNAAAKAVARYLGGSMLTAVMLHSDRPIIQETRRFSFRQRG